MTIAIAERHSLSLRLKTETSAQHERMHNLMEGGQPFASRENYVRYVVAQYFFQRDIEHLFANPQVQAAVPDFDVRGRQEASRADLDDLGATLPQDDFIASAGVTMPEALGWVYVSEGSTLGAAFLLKEAQARLDLSPDFGARNLAAYPEGRAAVWRRFVAALDGEAITPEEHDAVVAGAHAAYNRFGALLQHYFQIS
ncbi:biliverdin-producing heme oxygenase [Thauera linaloolentis]|uniref:Heme oxygenase n=1 Tax=Thauera linaloolentis (strain DSM 12138 / JCM 21573 / CCUG 41526 / CIP 105981 / IAM 15112 / NBRC 102519 / 47Lol) TaxID=1123367 RepID=N6XPJ9_THAL4|nr:biliverdin-producing heme oxygenase [Thauera linaloolentis]ENO83621.1 heme oxygenase [Thauera linaloolentis 47Lol = DSM 12138]MCM8565951.1 biliverdin-producing heme oxygenase [Thauera linaloolentis]